MTVSRCPLRHLPQSQGYTGLSLAGDIFKDIMDLSQSVDDKNTGGGEISLDVLQVFENVAYVMAKHADPSQPDTPEEWLDQFDTFSIYVVLPQLLTLWHLNTRTDVESKKKSKQPAGK